MAAVAYWKMNNICNEEGEANGGVFVGDSIVSISTSKHFSMGFPAFVKAAFSHTKPSSKVLSPI